MFVEANDYRMILDDDEFQIVADNDNSRKQVESAVIEHISGYLRSRYDLETVFTATGNDRNPKLVLLTVTMTSYHLTQTLSGRDIPLKRAEQQHEAIKLLEEIRAGRFDLDLPKIDSEDSGNPSRWGTRDETYYW